MTNLDRYLKITDWARKRYTINGFLPISHGGKPSRYSIIEKLAAMRLLNTINHWN